MWVWDWLRFMTWRASTEPSQWNVFLLRGRSTLQPAAVLKLVGREMIATVPKNLDSSIHKQIILMDSCQTCGVSSPCPQNEWQQQQQPSYDQWVLCFDSEGLVKMKILDTTSKGKTIQLIKLLMSDVLQWIYLWLWHCRCQGCGCHRGYRTENVSVLCVIRTIGLEDLPSGLCSKSFSQWPGIFGHCVSQLGFSLGYNESGRWNESGVEHGVILTKAGPAGPADT